MEETSYVAESEPMSLARFAGRYRPSHGSPQAAMVCGSGLHSSEQQLLAEGTQWKLESTVHGIIERACDPTDCKPLYVWRYIEVYPIGLLPSRSTLCA